MNGHGNLTQAPADGFPLLPVPLFTAYKQQKMYKNAVFFAGFCMISEKTLKISKKVFHFCRLSGIIKIIASIVPKNTKTKQNRR
ncbi:MAG TPA: hypothetical protein DCG49_01475 [Ruminococcus sp.]|nr:hypothetical protein [Ruminococcus sp.]